MMSIKVSRIVYQYLLRMHPRDFRSEFADEMLWIFDEAAIKEGTMHLLADGVGSLARQWLARGGLKELLAQEKILAPANGAAGGPMTWEHIEVPQKLLPIMRIMQGSLAALIFLAGLSFAASRPVKNRLAELARSEAANRTADGRVESSGRQEVSKAPMGGVRGGVRNGVSGGISDGVRGEGVSEGIISGQNGGITEGVQGELRGRIADGWNGGERDGLGDGVPADANGGLSEKSRDQRTFVQGESPNAPAREQLMAWLDAFNSGDREKLRAFDEKNYPDEVKELDGVMGFREATGGFEFKRAEAAKGNTAIVIVKERDSDQFARMEVEVDATEPHRITKFGLQAIATPAEFALPRMSEEQAVAALRAEIEKQVAADKFAGAVMVTRNGKTVFSGAWGMADRDKKTKNEVNTRFRIGSMNKMFTAVSVLQLAQAGKLKLTAPLGEYLTDYPNQDLASKVTIHELLTHTGGTGDFFGPKFDQHRLELKTLQDYVKLYGDRGPKFEPGSKWEYSNYGFLLLGVTVQKVSGQDYYDYVREHVYKPAGMISTDSLPEEQAVERRSVGYTKVDGKASWGPNTDTLPYRGTSAGGGYSTVEDLQRFAAALREHKLLNAEYTEMLTTGKAETGGGDKYAYGFMDRMSGGVRSFGHGGGAPGMNGDLTIYPQSGYVVTVLANMDPPAAQRVAAFIGNRLPEK